MLSLCEAQYRMFRFVVSIQLAQGHAQLLLHREQEKRNGYNDRAAGTEAMLSTAPSSWPMPPDSASSPGINPAFFNKETAGDIGAMLPIQPKLRRCPAQQAGIGSVRKKRNSKVRAGF